MPSPLFKLGSKVPYALHDFSGYFFGEKNVRRTWNKKGTSKELGTKKERQKNKKRTSKELGTEKERQKNKKRTSKELGTEEELKKNSKGTSEELRTKKEHLKFLFCSSGVQGDSPATIPFDTRVKGSIVLQLPTN